jgi:alkanesulfonate monooxygenase SsuD/methylene tetrahydromethanopterin reductase-like flavin-dependent oxidoreductase (luciferase family)
MLAITLPHVDAWNVWFNDTGNRPEGVPALRAKVDAACRAVGRDPAEVERTVAVLVRLPGGAGRAGGDAAAVAPPIEGPPEVIAETLRRFAEEGIAHVQLVIDPITTGSLEALAPVLELLGT